MSGNGQKEGSILFGMMNLHCNPIRKQWMQIQEHYEKLILDIGNDEVLAENIERAW